MTDEKRKEYKKIESESKEPKKRWHYIPFPNMSYAICEPTVVAKTKQGALLKIEKECKELDGYPPNEIWWKRYAYKNEF